MEFKEDWQARIDATLKTINKESHDLEKPMSEDLKDGQKFCPFRSTPEKLVACTGNCMLYRPNKPGYECYFMELQSISYFISGKRKKPNQ